MSKEHIYKTDLVWTGNRGSGTKTYKGYSRAHEISIEGKPPIVGSSDPHFNGDPARYNPEELLVPALSACHMLYFIGFGQRSRDNDRPAEVKFHDRENKTSGCARPLRFRRDVSDAAAHRI